MAISVVLVLLILSILTPTFSAVQNEVPNSEHEFGYGYGYIPDNNADELEKRIMTSTAVID